MRAQRQLTHQRLSKAHAAIARQKAEAAIRQPRLIYCISDRYQPQRQLTHQGLSKAHAAIARQKAEAAIRQPRLIYCISDRYQPQRQLTYKSLRQSARGGRTAKSRSCHKAAPAYILYIRSDISRSSNHRYCSMRTIQRVSI